MAQEFINKVIRKTPTVERYDEYMHIAVPALGIRNILGTIIFFFILMQYSLFAEALAGEFESFEYSLPVSYVMLFGFTLWTFLVVSG